MPKHALQEPLIQQTANSDDETQSSVDTGSAYQVGTVSTNGYADSSYQDVIPDNSASLNTAAVTGAPHRVRICVAGSSASEPRSVAPSGGDAPGNSGAEAATSTTRALTANTFQSISSDKSRVTRVDPTAGLAIAPWAGTASSAGSDSTRSVDGDGGESRLGGDKDTPGKTPRSGGSRRSKRTLGVLGLALMAYLTVSAGPYSIEEAVAAGGPGPVLLGAILLGLLWGLPQSLVTAELSCMMDENGSYVLWVERGLGPFAAWVSSFNSALSNTCDLPLYCILLSQYVSTLAVHFSGVPLPFWAQLVIRGATLCFILTLNLRGINSVAKVGLFVVVVMMTPFLLQPMVGYEYIKPHLWVQALPAKEIEWATLTSTLLWNYQGWDSCGSFAGDVKDAKRTYVLGIGLALLMTVLSYLIPVATNAGVNQDWGAWQDGSLASMASTVAPWLGVWVVLGAVLAQLGNGLTMLAASSRVLWQMAHRRMLPPQLGISSPTFGTPVSALWTQAFTTALLMSLFDFRTLVVYDTFFNNVSLVLETAAFLRLRYIEANTHRPFTVPGGLPMAWGLTLSKAAVLAFAFGTVHMWQVWVVAGVANALIIVGWLVVTACRRADLKQSSGTLQPADEAALLLSEV